MTQRITPEQMRAYGEQVEEEKRLRAGMPGGEIISEMQRYCAQLSIKYGNLNTWRVESVDLTQVGMIAVLESMEDAQAKYADPLPYLKVAARHAIIHHCLYDSHLIRVPRCHNTPNTPHLFFALEHAADVQQPPQQQNRDYQNLYQAIERLPRQQRRYVETRYGLNGNPETSLESVSLILTNGKSRLAGTSYARAAFKSLKRILAEQEAHV